VFVESNWHTLALFGQSPTVLKATLEGFGYRNYLVQPGRLRPARADDIQPSPCVDYLAVKGEPRLADRSWRVDRPLTRSEVLQRIRDAARADNPAERGALARALAGAPGSLLALAEVRKTVQRLRDDPAELVQDAADSVRLPDFWRDRLMRWSGGRR
jgi:hypothetical protein